MKQIKVNPNNEQFYSKEFIRGFNLGAERQFEADIADMPTWIPCSERLPEEDGHYIVYAPSYRGGSSGGKEKHNGVMFSRFKNGKWSIEVGYHKRPGCVKAWMPIVPWEGEKND